MRRRAVIGATTVAAVALLAVAQLRASPAASAAPAVAVGWWTRSATAAPPPNGVAVGAGVDGASSVAALTVDLGAGVDTAVVTLSEAGGLNRSAAAVDACPLTEAWDPVAGGAWDAAPATACEVGTTPVLTDRDGTWTIDLVAVSGRRSGTVSVLVVPRPGDGDLPAPWELSYEQPDVSMDPSPPPPTSSAPVEPQTRPDESPAPADVRPPPAFDSLDDGAYTGAFTAPPSAAPPPTTVPSGPESGLAAPAATPAPQAAPTSAIALPAGIVAGEEGRSLGDALQLTALSLAAGALAVAARKGGRRLTPLIEQAQDRRRQHTGPM